MVIIEDIVNDKKGYSKLIGTQTGPNRDDRYVIKKFSSSFTEIDDANGFDFGPIEEYEDFGNDTVIVENVKPDDLTLFFDYSIGDEYENPESRPADELYIVKKSALSSMISTTLKGGTPKSNGILITSQFGETNNGGSTMSFGAIEDLIIHDTKTDIGRRIYMSETMEVTKAQVKALLEEVAEKGLYTIDLETGNEVPILSAFQLLASKHKTYKNKLINIFKNQIIHTEIYGTSENDKIVGGKGNDEIYSESGNDTITGKTGKNTVYYAFRDDIENNSGNDVINLTKGENLVLDIAGADIEDIRFEYSKNKKDLIIYLEKDDEGNFVESITLKNFAYKDVTNNSTKKTEDTSSVILKAGLESIDLRKDLYLTEDNIINVFKNYTGTWLDEEINANNLEKFDKKGNPLTSDAKGLTLDGKGGDDIIVGSKYADVIKGGDGNDIINGYDGDDKITGGKGENSIYHRVEQGNDIIYLTKGETLHLEMIGVDTLDDLTFTVAKNKKDLEISRKDYEGEKVTLKNYYSKELGATVLINNVDLTKDAELGVIDKNNYFEVPSTKIKTSYTGSALADEVDASGLTSATNAKTNAGVKITTKAGDDIITGSDFNDTITGGTGKNLVKIYANQGNDVINLTKGENLVIDLVDVTGLENVKFEFVKNDLRIYTPENNYLTLKNFVAKNVTNNGNAKKGIEDTSSVILNIGENEIDLRKAIFDKKYLYQINPQKNYTGSWLSERIEAIGYEPTKGTKGLSINAKGGDDVILGSNYADTIKGGDGNDSIFSSEGNDKIYGEAGENTLLFKQNSGNDTIYGGKGEDTLVFEGVNFDDLKFSRGTTSSTKNDLIIQYTENDSVTVKNFFKLDKKKNPTNSVKHIVTADKTIDFDSILAGTAKGDKLTPANGNNYIFASEGVDTINSGVGVDTLVFTNESLADHDDPPTINATWSEDSEDLIITAKNSGATMVLKDYGFGNHSAQWIIVGDEKIRIDSIVDKNIVDFDDSTPLVRGTSRSDGIEINSVGTPLYPTYISSYEGDDIINLTDVANFGIDAGKGNDLLIMNGSSYGEIRLVAGNGDDTFWGIENADSRYSVILNAQIEGSRGTWLGDELLLRKVGNHEFILGEQVGDNLVIKLTSDETFTVVDYFKSNDNFGKLKFLYRSADGVIDVRPIIAYLLPKIPTVVDLDMINNTYEDLSDKLHFISATEEGLYNIKLGDGSNNQIKIGNEEADELLEAPVNIELGNGDNNSINLFKTGSITGVTVGDGNYNYIYMGSTYNEDALPPNTHANINVGNGDGNEVDIWNDGTTILNIGNGEDNYVYTYGNGNTIINSSVDTDTDETTIGSCYFEVGKNSRENFSTTTITSYGNDTICGSGRVELYVKNGAASEKLVETNFRDRDVDTKSITTVHLDDSNFKNNIQIGVGNDDYISYISFNKTPNNSYDFVYGAMDSDWNEVDGEVLIKDAYVYNESESEWQFRFDKDTLFENLSTEETHGLSNEYELYYMDKMNHFYDKYELPDISSIGTYIKGSAMDDEYWYEFENLTIKEKGGEDTLNIGEDTKYFKFFYDIDKNGNVGNDLILAAEYSTYQQFSKLFNTDEEVRNSADYLTIKDYFLTVGGSIENICAKDTSNADVKLNYDALVRTENFTWGGSDAETSTIIQNVVAWLDDKGYTSAMEAIEKCTDQDALNSLMSCYTNNHNYYDGYWVAS